LGVKEQMEQQPGMNSAKNCVVLETVLRNKSRWG